MARSFEVTAATQTVSLDLQRKGETAFTVTNTGDRPVRGRLLLKVDGQTELPWIRIEAPERSFAPHAQETFAVHIEVPAAFPPGEVRFHVEAVAEDDPDEDWTAGPTVAFTVKGLEPGKKTWIQKYWWILVIIGGVVVVTTAIVLAVVLSKEQKPGFGDDCSGVCADGLVCRGTCVRRAGQPCGSPEECESARCEEGTCAPLRAQSALLDNCGEGRPACGAALNCVRERCRRINGEPCENNFECASSYCDATKPSAVCADGVRELGDKCADDSDCRTGQKCAPPSGEPSGVTRCRGDVGFTGCGDGADCVSGLCQGSPKKCEPPPTLKPMGEECSDHGQCMAPAVCAVRVGAGSVKRCRVLVGEGGCATDDHCTAGVCTSGHCGEPSAGTGGIGDWCTRQADCRADLVCSTDAPTSPLATKSLPKAGTAATADRFADPRARLDSARVREELLGHLPDLDEVVRMGRCLAPNGHVCTDGADCVIRSCVRGRCGGAVTPCASNRDCGLSGFRCVVGACVPLDFVFMER